MRPDDSMEIINDLPPIVFLGDLEFIDQETLEDIEDDDEIYFNECMKRRQG